MVTDARIVYAKYWKEKGMLTILKLTELGEMVTLTALIRDNGLDKFIRDICRAVMQGGRM